jgi:hypothetical protein
VPETRRDPHRLGDPQRSGRLQHDVVIRHWTAPFDRTEMRFHPPQPRLVVGETLLDLRPPDAQHPSELVEWRLVVEHVADLVEAQAEIP